ncbi:MAG: AAA family ATPase [Microcystaceae cyanobacterium]
MLKTISLKNFKSHKDTTLELDKSRLHAIVGKNSSGKTSVLEAIYYLSLCSRYPLEEIFKDESSPNFLVSFSENSFALSISGYLCTLSDNEFLWDIIVKSYRDKTHKHDSSGKINTEILKPINIEKGENNPQKNLQAWINRVGENYQYSFLVKSLREDLDHVTLNPLRLFLRDFAYIKLSTKNLSKAAYSEDITPTIGLDGSNLAPTLDYIRNEYPEQFKQIEESLKQVVPNVQKIGIKRAKVMVSRQRLIEVNNQSIPYEEKQEFAGQEVVLDMKTGERIPAHAISEGTMLTLGLLTVLMNPNQPNLVLLDDIEQGLHPQAQRDLMDVFKQILDKNPNLQIIFTTHSPYIIDELEPSQVHVLSNDSLGFTITQRLDEHPNIEWAIETLTTGEFLSAEGEEWVKKGDK